MCAPEYRSDYKAFLEQFGDWFQQRCFWFEEAERIATWTKREENHYYENIFPVIASLCHGWQLGNLFPPHWRFSSKTGKRKFRGKDQYLPTAVAPQLNWDLRHMHDLMEYGFTGTGDTARRYLNHLVIQFDLNWPLKDLLQYAEYTLKRARGNYSSEREEDQDSSKNTRRRFQDYALHLRVWDLAQGKKTVPEIARLLFPTDVPYSAEQKVRDHLNTAGKLVSGGYKEIR